MISERPISEMSPEEIEEFISQLREQRKNVSLRASETRAEKVSSKAPKKEKDTFKGDSTMNNLLDDILKDI